MVTAEYKLQGETLRGMMQLCVELQSVTGMAPDKITIEDGHIIAYDEQDAKKYLKGWMKEEEYIHIHVLFSENYIG